MPKPKMIQGDGTELIRLGARRIENDDGTVIVIVPIHQGAGAWTFVHYQDGKPFATSNRSGLKSIAAARDELETICEDYRS
jgi:hypothetical protein